MRTIALLLLALSCACVTASSQEVKLEAKALANRAADQMDIWSEARSGLQVKARFYAKNGQLDSQAGFSAYWLPSGESSTNLTAQNYTKITYSKDKASQLEGGTITSLRPLRIEEALWPLTKGGLRRSFTWDNKASYAKVLKRKASCWSPEIPNATRIKMCVDQETGRLVQWSAGPWRIEYSDYQPFGNKTFPRRIRVYEDTGSFDDPGSLVEDIALEILSLTPEVLSLDPSGLGLRVTAITGCSEPIPPSFPVGKALTSTRPTYPTEAKINRQSGKVTFRVLIGLDGQPREALLITSAGEALNQATLQFILQSRYRPIEVCGKAVEAPTYITVNYALGS